jgi:hypothetical protein
MKHYTIIIAFLWITNLNSFDFNATMQNSWNAFAASKTFSYVGMVLAFGAVGWGLSDFYSAYKNYNVPFKKEQEIPSEGSESHSVYDLHKNNKKRLKELTVSQNVVCGFLKCCVGFVALSQLIAKKS